ncbi:DUF4856 domain-containing protein [Rhodohalobacter barkolensis]|uniref:DUF4856 domain-containing protein n=1 Tax=Rhodohalobacter barkolensis TaxID=2053187 RepID=A0A2N0VJV6_9BACT|nr:DUF4856 domain-containing protein [Rhodohalobacter barkolensis]PKD44472.1 DUF4856 domain-containing protein [Rhodohalobacter barkolensis]
MNILKLFIPALIIMTIISCDISDSDSDTDIETPSSYEFTRNGESTVSFSGQTTRIRMAMELNDAMMDFDNSTEELLLQMYRNQTADGGDANPFSESGLNESTKSVKGKVAASADYFASNTAASAQIKSDFEEWISGQVNEVFPNENELAEAGVPGQLADGSTARYVNAKGLEYDQMVAKSLNGALMADQMLNNYLSVSVLDAGTNREDNDNDVLEEGTNYTTMEHKWDEAYGYLFGNAANPANPLPNLGEADDFLNKYLGRVLGDPDFEEIPQEIFDAFALGRAAIVAGDYDLRDQQAQIIRQKISEVIAIRAVYYLQSGKNALDQQTPDYGGAFHDLSEGFGFIYSLQFTRVPNTDQPYLTKSEVDGFIAQLTEGNGLWDVSFETLDQISNEIASKFDFTIEEASS